MKSFTLLNSGIAFSDMRRSFRSSCGFRPKLDWGRSAAMFMWALPWAIVSHHLWPTLTKNQTTVSIIANAADAVPLAARRGEPAPSSGHRGLPRAPQGQVLQLRDHQGRHGLADYDSEAQGRRLGPAQGVEGEGRAHDPARGGVQGDDGAQEV